MQASTFLGEVQNGLIVTEQPLTKFEGEKVSVTVLDTETSPSAETGELNEKTLPDPRIGSEEPILLEDLCRIQMPRRNVTTVHLRITDVGRRSPRVYSSEMEE
jgi:hypothetical protein